MTALSFAFTKIVVSDLEASEQFYCQALGLLRVTFIEFGEGVGKLQEVILAVPNDTAGGANLQLIHFPNKNSPAPGDTVLGFMVDNVDATVSALTDAGGRITVPALEMPDHRLKLAYVADLDGHIIEIIQNL